VAASKRRRFVIQKHDATRLHYDLRLEFDGVFKSWAVTRGPSLDPADKRLAVEVEDHPLDYGDFEGTIPKGEYGGGTVQMWDRGFWAPQGPKSPEDAIKAGDFKFVLAGERLKGSWVLVRIRNNRGRDTRTNWLLIKHKDEYAVPGGTPELIAEDRSVASGRSMEQIAAGVGKAPRPFMLAKAKGADAVWHSNRAEAKTAQLKSMPEFIEPQLTKLVERPPAGAGWAHEIKFDGYRVQLRVEDGEARIRTRSGLDWTEQFAAIAKAARVLPDCILDGEICAVDKNNMPSFAALQAALAEERSNHSQGAVEGVARGSRCRRHVSIRRAFQYDRQRGVAVRVQDGSRRHRLEAPGRAVRLRPQRRVDQGQVPRWARGRPRRLDY
jgi:bifunctional non-homologous end joining protein LigD